MSKTCKDCIWFYDQSGTGSPILDECVCWKPGGGKNYFTDIEPISQRTIDATSHSVCPYRVTERKPPRPKADRKQLNLFDEL